jgi:hypothetical protein
VEARKRRRNLIVRDLGILGTGCEEALFGSVEQFVTAYFEILAAYDKDVEA